MMASNGTAWNGRGKEIIFFNLTPIFFIHLNNNYIREPGTILRMSQTKHSISLFRTFHYPFALNQRYFTDHNPMWMDDDDDVGQL